MSRIRAALAIELPLAALFEAPTVAALAVATDAASHDRRRRRACRRSSVAPAAGERAAVVRAAAAVVPRSARAGQRGLQHAGGVAHRAAGSTSRRSSARIEAIVERHEVAAHHLRVRRGRAGAEGSRAGAVVARPCIDLDGADEVEARTPGRGGKAVRSGDGPAPARAPLAPRRRRSPAPRDDAPHRLRRLVARRADARGRGALPGVRRGERAPLPSWPCSTPTTRSGSALARRATCSSASSTTGASGSPARRRWSCRPIGRARRAQPSRREPRLRRSTAELVGAAAAARAAPGRDAVHDAAWRPSRRCCTATPGRTISPSARPIANRTERQVEELIGFFVNTLVLRAQARRRPQLRRAPRPREARGARRLRAPGLPFERLVEELQPERDLSRTPLFQVMFALQNAPAASWRCPTSSSRSLPPQTATAKFDLDAVPEERGDELAGSLEYATDLFDATTIERLVRPLRDAARRRRRPPRRAPLASCRCWARRSGTSWS